MKRAQTRRQIRKVLVANRGEIAVRIIRSCKELGISTVAVHSEVDESCLHVKIADESVCIGPAKSQLSYLNIPSLLSAAEITESDAIHPGYGFLAENAEFARMCQQWGIIFIGPAPDTIEQMGDKIRSKILAEKYGVPVLRSLDVQKLSESEVFQQAELLGYPLLVKASAGGGGRGMRKVFNAEELGPCLDVLRQEAKAHFANGDLFVENYIEAPRHIEVQLLGDSKGHLIHLGERDCTIQRRYQKVIEESPALVLSEKEREQICTDALKIASALSYESAGTVEFLFDLKSRSHFFMEMNTRIQVEHPVTEQRTGVDLIAEQIKVASGEELSLSQENIRFDGHVIEMRINAEDPWKSVPCPGKIDHYHRPGGPGVRVDDFIYTGYEVGPFYDSMIAKVIVSANDRASCIQRCLRALDEMVVGGLKTNIELHKRILEHSDFQQNNYSTHFLSDKLL